MPKAVKKVIRKNQGAATAQKASKAPSPAKKRTRPVFVVRPVKEITASFPDQLGLTAKVAAALAAENVNILAGTGYSASAIRREATFTLVTSDLAGAERALEKIGADEIHESSVIMVETANKAGSLEKISRIIADADINICYFYTTTSSGKTATCVFKTADDKKAIKALSGTRRHSMCKGLHSYRRVH